MNTKVSGGTFPPLWLPMRKTGPCAGNPVQVLDVGAEIQRGQQPRHWQGVANVIGIPLVEVSLGDPRRNLLPGPLLERRPVSAIRGLYPDLVCVISCPADRCVPSFRAL